MDFILFSLYNNYIKKTCKNADEAQYALNMEVLQCYPFIWQCWKQPKKSKIFL